MLVLVLVGHSESYMLSLVIPCNVRSGGACTGIDARALIRTPNSLYKVIKCSLHASNCMFTFGL